ncbi:hypothetical protein [Pseudooceanicola sp. LIPI14-2-Ac024]|uniref:hypothetical protein n=1 Tax=Pseudooceanicola sp. LIPI14-2-Ac024 TaxID=3344875 RepID=UPI0035CE9D97
MSKTDRTEGLGDVELDALFAMARDDAPELPAGLAARMVSDGLAEQARRAAPVPVAAPPRPGPVRRFLAGIGGWPALTGLATATVAGVWIGISPPAVLAETAASLRGNATADDLYLVDVMSAFDGLGAEG